MRKRYLWVCIYILLTAFIFTRSLHTAEVSTDESRFLVQFVEMVIQKFSPSLYSALGIYLPLITTNCAVLGVAILNVTEGYNFIYSVTYGFSAGLSFMLAIVLFAGVRERLETSDIPKAFQGFPIALVTAGLIAMAFLGFQGLKF